MEDSAAYRLDAGQPRPVQLLDDPDFIGEEAELKRAIAKTAGLEPVVAHPSDTENNEP